jgi:hypothetical protein
MEVKKKVKVMYAFSQAAAIYVDINGWESLIKDKHESLQEGYDYGVKEFDTKREAEAYVSGVNDANGWTDPIADVV